MFQTRLPPAEKKKLWITSEGSVVAGLAIILGITIPAGLFTLNVFINLVGIFGIVVPTIYFFVMYYSPKTTQTERSQSHRLYSIIYCSGYVLGNSRTGINYPCRLRR